MCTVLLPPGDNPIAINQSISISKNVTACSYDMHYTNMYEGWNFNGGNYLFTTDTK